MGSGPVLCGGVLLLLRSGCGVVVVCVGLAVVQPATARAASSSDGVAGFAAASPFEGSITPAQALRFHVKDLSEYEQGEILEFKQVYCLVRGLGG